MSKTVTKFHRRGFLKGALSAGAAALAPTIIPSSALGLGGSVAPSERIVLGGIGMGMTVSPYLVAVQNAISPRDFGSSTATMNLMRAIGASLAVSIFGALLASRAKSYLAAHLGEHANKIDISRLVSGGTGTVHHSAVIESALLSGLHWVYAVAAVVGLFGIACALALQERPLSDRIAH